ncbi:class I SAM-dependent methyltransferase [Sunxiuqinia sp. sy24]|uniref:class I SAM-dependent methyltransferase n=1 Tax=Sunxiuqinia sp. sy24 TaxID=3461495 RepID=UPI00404607C9
MKQLQHFFKDKTVHQILDVGCGSGDFIKVLRDTFDEHTQITGIDPGEQWLKEARARFPQENINFSCMSGETLDFEDASFDVVSLSNALHHLKDLEQTLCEMKRVLKPGGWIIINEVANGDLTEAQENQKMLHHFKSFVDRLHGISHRQTWKPEEILAIIEHNKLSVIDSFEHLKMKKVNVEPHFLDEKYWQMESLQEELQGRPEYDQTKDQLPVFKERLEQYGFQTAPQLLVLAQAKNG